MSIRRGKQPPRCDIPYSPTCFANSAVLLVVVVVAEVVRAVTAESICKHCSNRSFHV